LGGLDFEKNSFLMSSRSCAEFPGWKKHLVSKKEEAQKRSRKKKEIKHCVEERNDRRRPPWKERGEGGGRKERRGGGNERAFPSHRGNVKEGSEKGVSRPWNDLTGTKWVRKEEKLCSHAIPREKNFPYGQEKAVLSGRRGGKGEVLHYRKTINREGRKGDDVAHRRGPFLPAPKRTGKCEENNLNAQQGPEKT